MEVFFVFRFHVHGISPILRPSPMSPLFQTPPLLRARKTRPHQFRPCLSQEVPPRHHLHLVCCLRLPLLRRPHHRAPRLRSEWTKEQRRILRRWMRERRGRVGRLRSSREIRVGMCRVCSLCRRHCREGLRGPFWVRQMWRKERGKVVWRFRLSEFRRFTADSAAVRHCSTVHDSSLFVLLALMQLYDLSRPFDEYPYAFFTVYLSVLVIPSFRTLCS